LPPTAANVRCVRLELRWFVVGTPYAAETERVYRLAFAAWCRHAIARHQRPLPASSNDVDAYLRDLAARGYSWSTLQQVARALRVMHRRAGHDAPAVPPELWTALRKLTRARERRDKARRHALRLWLTDAELERLQRDAADARVSVRRLARERAVTS
jgi:hypothetical protein